MTIKDIAKECGCAVGTVSRVLNNQDYVSVKTREKVMEVVNKYNFVLNNNAKALKARGTKTILILVKGTSNILLNNLLEKVQKNMEKLPYTSKVIVLDEYDNEAVEAEKELRETKALGIIFLGGNPERNREVFPRINCPCVLISTKADTEEHENLSSVSTDSYQASLLIARHFAKKGHDKIGIIGGDFSSSMVTKRRYEGFLEGLELSGMTFDAEKSYATAKYSLEGGAKAAEELVKKFPDVTAIFAMSDMQAMGACRKLKDMGFRVPEDISVVGFDGLPIAQYYCPKITTIRQNEEELAVQGLKTLLDAIEKKNGAAHKNIPFEFVEGESVREISTSL